MIEILVADNDIKEDVWKLYQEYAKELAVYSEKQSRRTSSNYPFFDEYWDDDHRFPIVIIYDHELTGFCLLTDTGICYMIDEFYIRPLHRRRSFGKFAVEHIKDFCRQHGRHKTICANIFVNNTIAIAFWKSLGFKDTGRRSRVRKVRLMETEAEL